MGAASACGPSCLPDPAPISRARPRAPFPCFARFVPPPPPPVRRFPSPAPRAPPALLVAPAFRLPVCAAPLSSHAGAGVAVAPAVSVPLPGCARRARSGGSLPFSSSFFPVLMRLLCAGWHGASAWFPARLCCALGLFSHALFGSLREPLAPPTSPACAPIAFPCARSARRSPTLTCFCRFLPHMLPELVAFGSQPVNGHRLCNITVTDSHTGSQVPAALPPFPSRPTGQPVALLCRFHPPLPPQVSLNRK